MTAWFAALAVGLALGALAASVYFERRERQRLALLTARLDGMEARWLEKRRPEGEEDERSIDEVDAGAAEPETADANGVEGGSDETDPGTLAPTSDVLAGLTSHVQQLLDAGSGGVELLGDRAILAIYRRLDSPLTPSRLAAALYVSLRTLERGLVLALDCTPGQLIATVRMREARRLLGEGRRVSEVADRLGFANPFHFSRRYKRFYGVAPSEARRALPQRLSRPG